MDLPSPPPVPPAFRDPHQQTTADLLEPAATPVVRVRVLLVEDNDGDAALIQRLIAMAQAGTPLRPLAVVRRVPTVVEACAVLAEGGVDVVLLDLGLPDAHGLDALQEVRRAAPAVPVVVLTGLDDEAAALAALRADAQDYLVKDAVTGDLVLRTVRYAIERKRSKEEVARARWLAGIGETAIAVRHEVNNPLAALLMNAELLQEDGAGSPEALEEIIASARRIAEVVGRLAHLDEPRVVEYLAGVSMLDLSSPVEP